MSYKVKDLNVEFWIEKGLYYGETCTCNGW